MKPAECGWALASGSAVVKSGHSVPSVSCSWQCAVVESRMKPMAPTTVWLNARKDASGGRLEDSDSRLGTIAHSRSLPSVGLDWVEGFDQARCPWSVHCTDKVIFEET